MVKIKPRNISHTGTAPGRFSTKDNPSTFPNIESKPKAPLPAPRFTGYGRELGPLALACLGDTGASTADDGFTAGDYLQNVRMPNDPTNATEVRYRNRIRNRATGIVAKCVDCAGTRKGVTECAAIECPLWGFRLGSNPFRRKP